MDASGVLVQETIRAEQEWNRETEAYIKSLRPGPLYLLRHRRHALARVEFRRTKRWRWIMTAVCVTIPLVGLIFVCCLSPSGFPFAPITSWRRSSTVSPEAGILGGFICLWPLLMLAGSVLSAAMAVISDRSRRTVEQLALTPLSGEIIAAARILPWPKPFVAGVLAAVPLYFLGGSWLPISPEGVVLTPLVFLPMRFLALLGLPALTPGLSTGGVLCGLFMAATDATLVWAGAHWGAGFAVWVGNLFGVVCFMLWRMLYLSVVFLAWVAAPFLFCFLSAPFTFRPGSLGFLPLVAQVVYLWPLMWFPARGAVRAALAEFVRYDRLAGDDFRAGYFKRWRRKIRSEGPPRL